MCLESIMRCVRGLHGTLLAHPNDAGTRLNALAYGAPMAARDVDVFMFGDYDRRAGVAVQKDDRDDVLLWVLCLERPP